MGRSLKGFTLMETLIALVIAAAAAAIVLGQARTLVMRAEREQAHQLAALQLLNDSLRLASLGLSKAAPRLTQDALILETPESEGQTPVPVQVSNFSMRGDTLPPIAFAYTPYQLFGVSRDRYTLHALAPGLKPSANMLAAAGLTAPAPAPAAPAPAAVSSPSPRPAPEASKY